MSEFYKTMLDYKGKYGPWGIALLILVGAALIIAPGFFLQEESPAAPLEPVAERSSADSALSRLEHSLGERLADTLSQIEGAGSVAAAVTLESGYVKEYAKNESKDSSTTQERDNAGGVRTTDTANARAEHVFAQNSNEALITTELAPQIRGVLIVAEGASDSEVKANLSRAVQAMLNIPAHRVMVVSKESR
ncbi:MAG: hypothetical protein RBT41_06735 [Clostridia bacterium]|nr:hypothetical protein [Clostridia bacterium]